MMTMPRQWASHFPEDCPPAAAVSPSHTVFRFVRTERPAACDFESHVARFPEKTFEDHCDACGLSTYTDLDEVRRAQDRVPGMRKKKIAMGTLENGHGRILATPAPSGASHHSWWLPAGLDPLPLFEVIS